MSPSKPAVTSGVASICGPPPIGMKSAEQHVVAGGRDDVLVGERAVLLVHRMLVKELRHVATDDEQVKELVVDFGELRAPARRSAGARMENRNFVFCPAFGARGSVTTRST